MLCSTRSSAVRPLALAVFAAVSTLSAGQAFAGKAMLSGLQSDQSFDQFIVKYRDGSQERRDVNAINRGLDRAARAVVSTRSAKGAAATPTTAKHFRRMALGADVVRVGRKLDRVDAETLMRQIAADPNVEYVEVDVRMYPVLTPNDTRYSEQWHYFGATAGINLPTAWDKSTGSGMVVAVIDTGITPHSDLNSNIVAGYDFITDTTISQDGNGRDSNPNDPGDWFTNSACGAGAGTSRNSSWHGTHVTGTIAAVTNNSNGVAGVAYGAKVQPVRVLGRCGGTTSDIADAIVWASGGTVSGVPANATPARIINMSLGGSSSTCPTTYQNAINGAVGRGTTVIVAAGNSNNNASGNTPANCASVVTVGAVDSNGARSVWSSTQKSSYGSVVDLAAPGTNILSTLNAGTQGQGAESYAFYGGTSMATPHVAGVAALVQSRRQALGLALYTPAELETLLKNNVRPFPATPDQPIGVGMLNADAAVTAAGGGGGGGGSTQTYTNTADYTISDNITVNSPIAVSGRTGNGSATTSVAVNIVHTYIGDLKVDLVAPDGSVYILHNRAGGSADNIVQTYTVNLSSEALNGTWNLRVNDNAGGDVGYINSWSVTF